MATRTSPARSIAIGRHHRLSGKACRDYLSKLYYRKGRTAASSSAIADAQHTLSALARFEGETHPVYVRLAAVDGRVFLDLADTDLARRRD